MSSFLKVSPLVFLAFATTACASTSPVRPGPHSAHRGAPEVRPPAEPQWRLVDKGVVVQARGADDLCVVGQATIGPDGKKRVCTGHQKVARPVCMSKKTNMVIHEGECKPGE